MTEFDRRDFLRKTVFGITGIALSTGLKPGRVEGANNTDRPNIVLIVADDLGYGNLGCYGQETLATPNIDRLAEEGMRFTQFYAGSTVCAPSRSCLMTGQDTGHTRVRGNWSEVTGGRVPLKTSDPSMARTLQQAGYRAGCFGKWGLGEPETSGMPHRQGFDEFYGYLNQHYAHNYYPAFLWEYKQENGFWSRDWFDTNAMGKRDVYSHTKIHQQGLDFIRRNRDNPFFLFLSYTLPHAYNELADVTGNGMPVPSYGPYQDKPWPETEKGFAGMVHLLDQAVGEVMEQLEQLGISKETLVLFTSDNGPHSEGGHDPAYFDDNGPLRGQKRDLYEGGIRVPMIVRWPGTVPAGSTSDQPGAFWDLLPTFTDIAGVEAPRGITGISLRQAFAGRELQERESFYWEFKRGDEFKQAVRIGRWKGIRIYPDQPVQLFDLENDPGESENLAVRNPDIVRRIETMFQEYREETKHWPMPR